MLNVCFQANKKGPEFATTYQNTEQKIDVHFSILDVLLHQEALLSLLAFAQKLQPPKKKGGAVEEQVVKVSASTTSATPSTESKDKAQEKSEYLWEGFAWLMPVSENKNWEKRNLI